MIKSKWTNILLTIGSGSCFLIYANTVSQFQHQFIYSSSVCEEATSVQSSFKTSKSETAGGAVHMFFLLCAYEMLRSGLNVLSQRYSKICTQKDNLILI